MIHRGCHLPHVAGHIVEKEVGLPIICLDEEAETVRIVPGSHDRSNLELTTSKAKRNRPFIALVSGVGSNRLHGLTLVL